MTEGKRLESRWNAEDILDGLRVIAGRRGMAITRADIQVVEQAIRALTPSSEIQGWRDIKRGPPEGTQDVIVYTEAGLVSTRSARWVKALYDEAMDEGIPPAITHWQPLPEGPK